MKLKHLFAFLYCLGFALLHGQSVSLSDLKKLNIRNVGPANMSGRITSIAVLESNPKVMYVGAASGGVWKSENGGTAWSPIFDEQETQNIGAVAVQQDNPNVIWVGTGEGNPRNSMNLGMGIFKSIDGGNTWQHMGLEATKTIHRIRIDPTDGNTVYVGAMGDPFSPNSNRGLYKTSDGGKHWVKVLFTNERSGVADFVMHPTNPKLLFAAMYEHRRTPYYFTSGGEGSGLFVSNDGGTNWQKTSTEQGLPSGNLGRIGLAIAPSEPNRMYAKVEAKKNALYRSDDSGANWRMINDNPKFTNNRPFYFQDLAVDSEDPDRVYNIYQPLSVSYDGGQSFDTTPMIPADETKGIHADFHAFWVNPKDAEHFIIGGDGGLGITYDHGKTWYFPETIPVAQFYHIGVDNDTPFNVYGGMQDNGNWSGPGYTWKRGGIRTLYWQYLVGGDGFDISPDLDNSRFGYGSSQNGNLYRYDKLTGYYVNIKPPSDDDYEILRFNWNAGFARDPFDADYAYYGSQYVHRTRDKGANWEIISPDLTTNNPEHRKEDYGGLTLDVSGAERYNSILTIAPSALDRNILWVGTDDGQVQLSTNGGSSWKNVTKGLKNMPKEAWVTQIVASRHQAKSAWLVVNDYRKGNYAPYLFKTEDLGETWIRMVDDTTVKGYALTVVQDPVEPNLVFLGTENGLWISMDAGVSWTQFKNGFPSVSTMDITIQERESALIIGTFGRAIWVLDDLLSLREIAGNRLKSEITALPMNEAVQVKGLFINPPGNIWTGFHTTFEGANRVFQRTEIPFYLGVLKDSSALAIATIYNDKNEWVQTVEGDSLVRGLNYITWNLDEKSASFPGAKHAAQKIAVLPGNYKIVLDYEGAVDTTFVKVTADPRFPLGREVDEQLYRFRKDIDTQVTALAKQLKAIDQKLAPFEESIDALKDVEAEKNADVLVAFQKMREGLKLLRAKGQTPKPERQIGAWQSFEITPYSKLRGLLGVAAAQTTGISPQHYELLTATTESISVYSKKVETFMKNDWEPFARANGIEETAN